jgi:hypothetical protein
MRLFLHQNAPAPALERTCRQTTSAAAELNSHLKKQFSSFFYNFFCHFHNFSANNYIGKMMAIFSNTYFTIYIF